MGKRIFLLRHGDTGYSGRYIGAMDVPLAPEGVKRISEMKSVVESWTLDMVLVSPMLRCQQSAELLFPGVSFEIDHKLREVDFGRWEGLSFPEICERDPKLVESWSRAQSDFTFPEGEGVADFVARVEDVADNLLASTHKSILVISHGGVIRSLICHLLRLEQNNGLLFQIEQGNYASLDLFSEGGVLTGLNLGSS